MNLSRSQAARTRTCVIVDDVRAYRLQVKWWLDELGFQSIEASDAGQALEVIRTQHPDLVVTDIDMPGHSGLDLVRAVRDELEAPDSQVPVLVISSLEDDSIDAIVRSCRANGFLSKPLSREDLSAAIAKLDAQKLDGQQSDDSNSIQIDAPSVLPHFPERVSLDYDASLIARATLPMIWETRADIDSYRRCLAFSFPENDSRNFGITLRGSLLSLELLAIDWRVNKASH